LGAAGWLVAKIVQDAITLTQDKIFVPGELWLQNDKGVIMHLKVKQKA
jgi:hypothetical protein